MKRAAFLVVLLLAVAPTAAARSGHQPRIRVGWFSQQDGSSRAGAGAHIDVQATEPGSPPHGAPAAAHVGASSSPGSTIRATGAATAAPAHQPLYPSLPASSRRLTRPPSGPGSFWYQDGVGHACVYAPDSVQPCFTLIGGGVPGAIAPPLTPATIAAHVADRLALTPGQVTASPRRAGLTGAASWFWLDPTPTTQQLSLTLAGESVTVTAVPAVRWSFGDGATHDGGAGVPYQPGSAPAAAVTHVYNTRCLAGDQGRDPYVLSSCGNDGYRLIAAVTWQISYRATGSVAAAGTLPTRTTTSSTAYPVSEARAFLVSGAAG